MKELTPQEVKEVQLGILDVVHAYCREHDIKYWLDSGTLLGAIRHGGYIPWDDDIDLGMLRPDYERFMAEFNRDNNRFQFYSYENNKNFMYPFGKVLDTSTVLVEADNKLSVNVDIFVFDNVPDDEEEIRKLFDRRELYRRLHYLRTTGLMASESRGIKKVVSFFIRLLIRLIPKGFFAKRIVELSKRYTSASTKRVGDVAGVSRMVCDRSAVDNLIDASFENRIYKIPKGYDMWLRAFYDDYMQLPPEEERVSHHTFKAYWKD